MSALPTPAEAPEVTTAVHAGRDVNISGDVIGRDQINFYLGYTGQQLTELVTRLTSELRGADQPRTYAGGKPYRGLEPFRESDAAYFFGREALVASLIERLPASRFLCLAGPSGSGKSSLARAGLLHALYHDRLVGSARWRYAILSPRTDPLGELAQAINRTAQSPSAAEYLRQHGPTEPEALYVQAEALLTEEPGQRLVVLVDQFEEVFTQAMSEAARWMFIHLLTRAVQRPGSRVIVVITLRSEFISACAAYPPLRQLINQDFHLVGAMAPEELTRAIVMPALHAGIRVEPELAAQMIADMKGEPGALPMLQFTLKDLFEAAPRRAGDEVTLTLQAYLQRDGLYGALEKHAQAVLRSLTDEQRALARLLFAQLINVRSQALITRRIVPIETLLAAHTDRMAAEQVLHHLAEARLITTDDSGHQRTATLAHEKLIDSWSWLQQLIIEAGDRLRLQHQLDDDARTWERHQRDASYLYVGARLIGMQAQLARHQLTLAEPAHTFFQQSSEAQVNAERAREAARQRELILERRARKQQQWLTLVFAGLFTVAALVLGRPYALAWRARGEMVTVPAGPVVFGAREPDSNWSELKETALPSVPAFQLERYEVSNWQYRLCVDAGRCTTPILPTDFYDEAHLNHPVAGVSAVQAADYCRWLGRRLPTEVEWERAARGPNGQPWPWGDAPLTPERANVSFEGPPQDSKPVDSYPAGASVNPTGIFNLAGNVWEWTASYAQLAEAAYDPTFIWDGKGASLSKEMGLIQRGGGWEDPLMRVTYRFEYIGFEAIKSTGFRCAADR